MKRNFLSHFSQDCIVMPVDSVLETQAQFLVKTHGPSAQQRLIKEIREAGSRADSPAIRRSKTLLKRVTELLANKAA